jgi:hypothetical protein
MCLGGSGLEKRRNSAMPGSLTLRHKGTVCGDDEYAPIISYLILS